EGDQVGLLDAERVGEPGLAETGVALDHGQGGVLRRADANLRKEFEESLEDRDLGASHQVADAVAQRPEIHGRFGGCVSFFALCGGHVNSSGLRLCSIATMPSTQSIDMA